MCDRIEAYVAESVDFLRQDPNLREHEWETGVKKRGPPTIDEVLDGIEGMPGYRGSDDFKVWAAMNGHKIGDKCPNRVYCHSGACMPDWKRGNYYLG